MNSIPPVLPVCFLKLILIISIAFVTNVSATDTPLTSTDAKKIWEKSCFTCHGDSGDMARNFLKVVDGELQGPLHKDTFRMFLTNHYLSKPKAEAIYAMLLTQANAKSRFEKECSSCHQKATDLVRDKLVLHNGVLYNKNSKQVTYNFLQTHRNLKQEDVKFFMRKLTFLGYEIYQPIKLQ